MDIRDYHLPKYVGVHQGDDEWSLEAYMEDYKKFCEDLLTYFHTLEKRIAVLEDSSIESLRKRLAVLEHRL
jgi:hypothetical protein